MSDPNIPNIPPSAPADHVSFLTSVKSCIEALSGQGRNTDANRAVRVSDLARLGIDIGMFLRSTSTNPYDIVTPDTESESEETPDPPENLSVTKYTFSHELEWDNPDDPIVSHIEIWIAENSQDKEDAVLRGLVTVTETLMGEKGYYSSKNFPITSDMTYWIRSVSFAGNHSEWCPPDAMGGYVVTGVDSIGETIDNIIDILRGTTPELYASETEYSLSDLCRTSDGRSWKSIYDGTHSGNEPPNATYWERAGILLQGDVDGEPTVGIDGNLVVDDTILARHIQAGSINAGHIDTSEIFVGLSIQSSDYSTGSSGWKISNSGVEFVDITMTFSDSTARGVVQSALNVADGADKTIYTDSRIANSYISLSGLGAGDLATLSEIGADDLNSTIISDGVIKTSLLSVNDILISDTVDGTLAFSATGRIVFGSDKNEIYGTSTTLTLAVRDDDDTNLSQINLAQNRVTMSAPAGYISITANNYVEIGSTGNNTYIGGEDISLIATGDTYIKYGSTTRLKVTSTGVEITGDLTVSGTYPGGGGSGTVTSVTGTAPISVATGTTTPVISMLSATSSRNGYMTSTYAGKLDGIATGANNYSLPSTINVTNQGSSASCTGNAGTATQLATARTIGGVSFNGTANINLPGVNMMGNQHTTGNAATCTTASFGDSATGFFSSGTIEDARLPSYITCSISGLSTGCSSSSTSVFGSSTVTITASSYIYNKVISTGIIEFWNGTSRTYWMNQYGFTGTSKDLGSSSARFGNAYVGHLYSTTGYDDVFDDLYEISQFKPLKKIVVNTETNKKEKSGASYINPETGGEYIDPLSVPKRLTNYDKITSELLSGRHGMSFGDQILITEEDIIEYLEDYEELGWMLLIDQNAYSHLHSGALRAKLTEDNEINELIFSRITALEIENTKLKDRISVLEDA